MDLILSNNNKKLNNNNNSLKLNEGNNNKFSKLNKIFKFENFVNLGEKILKKGGLLQDFTFFIPYALDLLKIIPTSLSLMPFPICCTILEGITIFLQVNSIYKNSKSFLAINKTMNDFKKSPIKIEHREYELAKKIRRIKIKAIINSIIKICLESTKIVGDFFLYDLCTYPIGGFIKTSAIVFELARTVNKWIKQTGRNLAEKYGINSIFVKYLKYNNEKSTNKKASKCLEDIDFIMDLAKESHKDEVKKQRVKSYIKALGGNPEMFFMDKIYHSKEHPFTKAGNTFLKYGDPIFDGITFYPQDAVEMMLEPGFERVMIYSCQRGMLIALFSTDIMLNISKIYQNNKTNKNFNKITNDFKNYARNKNYVENSIETKTNLFFKKQSKNVKTINEEKLIKRKEKISRILINNKKTKPDQQKLNRELFKINKYQAIKVIEQNNKLKISRSIESIGLNGSRIIGDIIRFISAFGDPYIRGSFPSNPLNAAGLFLKIGISTIDVGLQLWYSFKQFGNNQAAKIKNQNNILRKLFNANNSTNNLNKKNEETVDFIIKMVEKLPTKNNSPKVIKKYKKVDSFIKLIGCDLEILQKIRNNETKKHYILNKIT